MNILEPSWSPSPSVTSCDTRVIQVWRVRWPELASNTLQKLYQCLSDREKRRADRYEFPRDRRRYIASRALTRRALASNLDLPEKRLKFDSDRLGKPALRRSRSNAAGPIFNLSRSGDLAVVVLSRTESVGVDIEALDPEQNRLSIAGDVLTTTEHRDLQNRPLETRESFFLHLWTCKEAVQKSTGEGLYRPPGTIELKIDSQGVNGVQRLEPTRHNTDPRAPEFWQLQPFWADNRTLGALAWPATCENPDVEVHYLEGTRRLQDL